MQQRHEVPQNFRRLLSTRLRRLVAQDKLEKVICFCYLFLFPFSFLKFLPKLSSGSAHAFYFLYEVFMLCNLETKVAFLETLDDFFFFLNQLIKLVCCNIKRLIFFNSRLLGFIYLFDLICYLPHNGITGHFRTPHYSLIHINLG